MASDSRSIEIIVDGKKANASVKEMEASVAVLYRQWKKMERGTEEYAAKTAELKEAKSRLGDVRAELRETDAATQSLAESFLEIVPFGGHIQALGDRFTGLKGSVGSLSGGFKTLKMAIASTGIGLLVVAIGSLVAWFQKTQKGLDIINELMGGFGAIIDVVLGRVIKFAEGLISFLSGDFEKGVEQMGGAFDDMGESMKNAFNEGRDIARATKELERFARQQEVVVAGLKAEAEAQNAIADDATRSFAEREAAAARARQASQLAASAELDIAMQQQALIEREIALKAENGQMTDELAEKQKEAALAVIQAEQEVTAQTLEQEKMRRELKQDRLERDLDILIDGFDNVKTINEKILADDKLTIDQRMAKLEELRGLARNSFNEQIATIQQFTGAQIDANDLLATSDAELLNQKIRNLGLSEVIEGRLLEVIRERRLALSDLGEFEKQLSQERIADLEAAQQKYQETMVEAELRVQQLRITAMEEGLEKELAQLDFDHQQKLAKLEEQRQEIVDNALLTEQQKDEALALYEEEKAALEAEKEEEEKALQEEERVMKLEKIIGDLTEEDELKKALLEQQFLATMDSEFQHEQARLNLQKQFLAQKLKAIQDAGKAETAEAIRMQNEITRIDKQIADNAIAEEQRAKEAKAAIRSAGLTALQDVTYAIIQLSGEETKAKKTAVTALKALQIGEVIINGVKEVQGYWSAYSSIPIAGPILAAVMTAAAVARTAIAISKISSTKYAEGGYTGSGISVDGNGYMVDSTGYRVAGVVHENEWVAPAWQVQDPKYANVIGYLEAARRTRGYQTGGLVASQVASAADISSSASLPGSGTAAVQDLTAAGVNSTNEKLDTLISLTRQLLTEERIVVPVIEVRERLQTLQQIEAKARIQ